MFGNKCSLLFLVLFFSVCQATFDEPDVWMYRPSNQESVNQSIGQRLTPFNIRTKPVNRYAVLQWKLFEKEHALPVAHNEFDTWIPQSEKSDFQKFAERHAAPKKLQKSVNVAASKVCSCCHYKDIIPVYEDGKSEPTCYIKHDIKRLIMAQRLREFIARNKLDKLAVADKYLVPVQDEDGATCWKVVAPAVCGEKVKNCTLDEAQQLATVAENAGYWDWFGGDSNILRRSDGKIVFIDTEARSFRLNRHTYHKAQAIERLTDAWGSDRLTTLCDLDKEAGLWLRKRAEELKKLNDETLVDLTQDTSFDDDDISIDNAHMAWWRYGSR